MNASVDTQLTSALLLQEQGRRYEESADLERAAVKYKEALRSYPDLRVARRRLAIVLVRLGRSEESLAWYHAELQLGDDGRKWLNDLIVDAMKQRDLSFAGDLAKILATLERGSEWINSTVHPPCVQSELSLPKLRHDIDQFRHLQEIGVLDNTFDSIIQGYMNAAKRLSALGNNVRVPLSPCDQESIGRVYGRIVHIAPCPRLTAALSPSWDRAEVQRLYQERRPGVVIIDDFLTNEALHALNSFCIESTIWSGNRYADGRLGAFFFSGFNCPLLLQIAEEIRDAFADVIGSNYPLRQLWGFKNTCRLPAGSTVHADFAAVNVNFWITSTAANLDDSSGGMVIYDIDAPLSWDFHTYNERIELIREFLATRQPRVIRIPYRQNRAIIFNSDLFHATESVHFRPDYESHRINITMLYGDRKEDKHHPPKRLEESTWPRSSAWRSGAFTRSRR